MRKTWLVGCILYALIGADSRADEILPTGCYVSYTNPNFCYDIPFGSVLIWTTSVDQGTLVSNYGPALAIILSRFAEIRAEKDGYLAAYNKVAGDYTTLANIANANEANRQEWIKYGQAQAAIAATNAADAKKQRSLVSKLRKACGSKCSKVR